MNAHGPTRWGPKATRTRTKPGNWSKVSRWNAAAEALGERHRVFCASLADVFDNHASIQDSWRKDLWELVKSTPSLDWMFLTKRPGNIAKYLPEDWGRGYPNVWLGATIVNQEEADRDIPKLMSVPATVRFLPMEPLIGPVDLLKVGDWFPCHNDEYGPGSEYLNALNIPTERNQTKSQIHLVIVGGETGNGARPMDPKWVRGIRDQCIPA